MNDYSHDTYISPFTWRYGSETMRGIWSEAHKRRLLRRVWIALARAEMHAGLVTPQQVDELERNKDNIDIDRASEIEAEIHHDLMAEIKTYAEQCPNAGSIIHLGATSMDALDNMDAMRQGEAMDLIIQRTETLLNGFAIKMEQYADVPCMAFTHIQPAEPTTVGYRFAQTAQDIVEDLAQMKEVRQGIRGKGMKGAVGTAASYTELLKGTGMTPVQLEQEVMEELGIKSFTAATQVYPRKQDWRIVTALSGLCCTLYKFAIDFRLLQSPPIGEWSEPFGAKQVGSSAMPFKRNPINCEKIDSLCRYVNSMESVVWQNSANTLLERTLDDSANRRMVLPAAFLAVDEVLMTATKIVNGMQVHDTGVQKNLKAYGLFAASERLLMELGRRGANRQEMHEVIRNHSLAAWQEVQEGRKNPLAETLSTDPAILKFATSEEVLSLLVADDYVGDAPLRTRMVLDQAHQVLGH
ncbi:MAG: adenylosuccinate lyase [Sphaerochaetaceae bacterium]|nr:adenylosuccinate lyase [Sphaerochaetaceae bacterium]